MPVAVTVPAAESVSVDGVTDEYVPAIWWGISQFCLRRVDRDPSYQECVTIIMSSANIVIGTLDDYTGVVGVGEVDIIRCGPSDNRLVVFGQAFVCIPNSNVEINA